MPLPSARIPAIRYGLEARFRIRTIRDKITTPAPGKPRDASECQLRHQRSSAEDVSLLSGAEVRDSLRAVGVEDASARFAPTGGPGLDLRMEPVQDLTEASTIRLPVHVGRPSPNLAFPTPPLGRRSPAPIPVLSRDYSRSAVLSPRKPSPDIKYAAIGNSRPVNRPYWVRCFVVDGRARLIDAPILSLKEA